MAGPVQSGSPLKRALTIAAASAAMAFPAQAQAPNPQLLAARLKEVGQVNASQCSGGPSRTGTAFVWPDESHVVTARHVVAGCQRIQILFPGGQSRMARPARELRAQDLALLRLDRPAAVKPLPVAASLPPIGARVAAIGFQVGAPTPDGVLLDVTPANAPPGSRLKDMLGDEPLKRLRQSGEINVETWILRLNGNLVPGLSGAPVIGPDGRVVAVGSGGLAEGAGGIVWAVRAEYLSQLGAAPPVGAIAALAPASGLQFAFQAAQASVETVACGQFSLAKSRTVPLSLLEATADDPRGLAQLRQVLGPALAPGGADRFDVWVDAASGASIPLPEGTKLNSGPVGCFAVVSGTVGMNIVTNRSVQANPQAQFAEANQLAQMFETVVATAFPMGLMPDPSFTYTAPLQRPTDGFVATRKAATGARMVGPNQMLVDYVFLTHMTRGRDFAGVAAFRQNMVMPADAVQACPAQPQNPACQPFFAAFRDWARAAIAVHLSTIPPI